MAGPDSTAVAGQRSDGQAAARPGARKDRELTARGIALGLGLAAILGAANAYLGLYAGMTVSASIPAAVVSMAALRLAGGATILENNVVQTIASAGEAVAAGAIFTFPALIVLGLSSSLPYVETSLLCVAGSTMGSLLVIFLRRAYIVEEKLPFPEGRACAEILRAGEQAAGATPLAIGGVLAALLKAVQQLLGWIPSTLEIARWVGSAPLYGSLNVSAALLGVGYIVGIRTGVLIMAGSIIAWVLFVPAAGSRTGVFHALPPAAAALKVWSDQARYLGVGAMLAGGVATLWQLRGRIAQAFGEGMTAMRMAAAPAEAMRPREERDLGGTVVLGASALAVATVFLLSVYRGQGVAVSGLLALVLSLLGFFAVAVAGYLTGIVGASNNPVSGVTVIVLLAVALALRTLGVSGTAGMRLAIMAAAFICTAAAMAGDSLHDLATGYHVGATPRALEIALIIGAVCSALVVVPVVNLLLRTYGIAGTPSANHGGLAAPQAFLMAQVGRGVMGGRMPWSTVAVGIALGLAIAIVEAVLRRRGGSFRLPVMPVAIGLYLPQGLSVTIFIGSLIHLVDRCSRRHGGALATESGVANDNRVREVGARRRAGTEARLLLAAGMIAGEALMGVLIGALVASGLGRLSH